RNATEDDAGDRSARARAAAADGISEQAADQRAGDHTRRVNGLAALLIKIVVIVGVGARVALAPALVAVVIAIARLGSVAGLRPVPRLRAGVVPVPVGVIGAVEAAIGAAVFVAGPITLLVTVGIAAIVSVGSARLGHDGLERHRKRKA